MIGRWQGIVPNDIELAADRATYERMRSDCLAAIEGARAKLDRAATELKVAQRRLSALDDKAQRMGITA